MGGVLFFFFFSEMVPTTQNKPSIGIGFDLGTRFRICYNKKGVMVMNKKKATDPKERTSKNEYAYPIKTKRLILVDSPSLSETYQIKPIQ